MLANQRWTQNLVVKGLFLGTDRVQSRVLKKKIFQGMFLPRLNKNCPHSARNGRANGVQERKRMSARITISYLPLSRN